MLDIRTCHKLLVYGGSFDPPHRAHVQLPMRAREAVGADGVIYVPSGSPPHKPPPAAAAEHRLAMLELALGDRDDAAIWTGELEHEGHSYTADTLRRLREELGPQVELRLLIGADMAAIFNQWRQPQRIIDLAEPLVMMREPYDADELASMLGDNTWRGRLVQVPRIDISSTQIRQHLRKGGPDDPLVREALAPAVLQYIHQHNLYRSAMT